MTARDRKHPIVAAIYDPFMERAERGFLGRLRSQIVGQARGRVVEIGAGTGRNFPHYRPSTVDRVDAIEPDPYMRRRAGERAARANLPIHLIDATGEQLPFGDAHADSVVMTLVLCSVDDPHAAVRELSRILKPEGKLLFIEHIRSDQPWRGRFQDLVAPVWRRLSANCHPNRTSTALLRASGFDVQESERVSEGLPWAHPIVAGVATRN